MIVSAVVSIAGLGLVLGIGLVLAARYLSVEIDPRVEQVAEELPNANCGACGYAGCAGFAAAVVKGEAQVTDCTPGGKETAARIAEILGVEAGEVAEKVAIVLCAGGNETAKRKSFYEGVTDCRAAEIVGGGDKLCPFGCLGLGTCREVCPFGAVVITSDRLAVIDPEKCTGCAKCVEACPRRIIKIVPAAASVHVLCRSQDKGKVVKAYCTAGCTACKLCTRESKVFDTASGLSVVDYEWTEEIPASAALVCGSQTIVDLRSHGLIEFVTDAALREEFRKRQEEHKEEQKRLKAAKKAKKDTKDERAPTEGSDSADAPKPTRAKKPAKEPDEESAAPVEGGPDGAGEGQ